MDMYKKCKETWKKIQAAIKKIRTRKKAKISQDGEGYLMMKMQDKTKKIKWKTKEQREKENRKIRIILSLLFLLMLTGLGVLGFRVWKQYSKDLMKNQYDQLSNSSKVLSGSLETSMKEYEWDYQIFCSIENMLQAQYDTDTEEKLKEQVRQFKEYLAQDTTYTCDIFWRDIDGNFTKSINDKQYRNPVLFTKTDTGIGIYQIEDEKGKKYLGLRQMEDAERQLCMVVDEGAFYENLISDIKVGTNGYVMIKNSDGKIIMHPNDDQWGIDVIDDRKEMYPDLDLSSLEHMIEKQKEGTEGILEYYSYWWTKPDLPRVHKVSAYAPADLGGDFWVVSAVIDYDDMYAPIREGFTGILLVMTGVLIFFLLLFVFVAKLMMDRQKSAAEIVYLRELNSLLEEVHQSEENIAHQQRLQIMGTMTGGIAHEFNNFLTPIMGYAELLMMELPEDSDEYDSVKEIYEASEKAKEVVRQISTLSRKNVETVYKSIPAPKLLTRAVKMISSVCPPQVNLNDEIHLEDTWILGNSTQINQVLLNISVNAVHAIGKKKGTITITADKVMRKELTSEIASKLRESWENYVKIEIRDDGCGMDMETLKHIFDPFFTTKKGGEGTGLGLALAEQIMMSHKGYVYAESEVGKGTTFYLYFPAMDTEQSVVPREEQRNYRIIVADDNAKVLKLLEKNFNKIGLEIITCMSIRKIKEHLETQEAAILFIDETLTDGSGVEFCMSIAGKYPAMKKIVMADHITRELAEARQHGVIDGYVEKPVSDTTLLEAVRQNNASLDT